MSIYIAHHRKNNASNAYYAHSCATYGHSCLTNSLPKTYV